MHDRKKAATKSWIATILEEDKDISVNELTYRLGNAVGLIDRNTVLDCLREMNSEEQPGINLPNFDDDSGLSGDIEEEDDGAIYHGCDGDDFDPYYEVETFRDRRLDQ